MFKQLAGIDILHVPYRGGAPAHIDLLAGRVHMMFDNIPQALAHHRDGQLRALAVTGAARSPQAPEIPAMLEFLPAFEITSWGGVCGPAGMPAPIVARIGELAREAVESADVRRRYEENGATVWWTTPQGLAEFRRENEARFAPLIRASGARVE